MIIDFLLLLVYSLLPGFAKVFDQQAFFLLNIPIIFFLLIRYKDKIRINKIDTVFFIFFIYVIINSIISFFSPHVNRTGLYMGVFMYFIPFVGFFYSKAVEFDDFNKIILRIIFVHCIIGILIYPAFGFGDYIGDVYIKLNDGVAFGRMSSVSGSLGLGNMMLVGFIIAYHKTNISRIYLIVITVCLILTLQRSAWLGAVCAVIISTIVNFKSIGVKKIVLSSVIFVLTIFLLTYISVNEDFDILFSRFSEFGSEAASERAVMWIGGIDNLFLFPHGAGIGQAGQISARYEYNPLLYVVPDGDFVRIVSETGIIGLLFYFFILIFLIYSLTTLKMNQRRKIIVVSLIFGYSIQMLGSNITEFYFTNFVYWIFIGYFFDLIKIGKNEN